MSISRFLALTSGLVLLLSAGVVGFANETDVTLKLSWPSQDIEDRPDWADAPEYGVAGVEASINFWDDTFGILSYLEMGEFEMDGISGLHVLNPGTAAERRMEFDTHTEIVRTMFHADMRVYLGNFMKFWMEDEVKFLSDSNLAFILGWHWQHYSFDRYVDSLSGHEADQDYLPWPDETGVDADHGGAYKLEVHGPEIGISADWNFYDQFTLHVKSMLSSLGRAEYFGEDWQEKSDEVYLLDSDATVTYDFAPLLEMQKQRLTAGLGYMHRLMDGPELEKYESHGAMLTIGYGFPHNW